MPEALYTAGPHHGVGGFCVPYRRQVGQATGMCFDGLCLEVVSVSAERLSDFCICQTYAISGYDTAYRRKWNVSHSFGKKAIGRYLRSGKERRYREDRWLKSFGLSRHELARAVEDRRSHPFWRFIYPEYEETTKRRLLSTEAGYLVCALSTLMWTPFSPSCSKCAKAEPCRRRHRRAIRNCSVSAARRGGKRRRSHECRQSAQCRVPV